ncbi:putative mrna cleavage factor complex component pcf11 protein [Botrytis fragariae]|uniref:Putative mrna cleavage factor complex component pcf11 protein n=1 Tax=Botrytis fragariae TaxID=1964551 RepID=A0A8H6EKY0_9HELO|nr:putative mrna cleavage factor complex component pcf11 protein [Botrytis fragariae]KAF5876063.1 putative mrna cleavage factor complex component pcf11 protein [Botrytis fragariae]
MSFGVPSDEVAEDYKRALEDLTMNSRYEISNLTVIAKENTEHALAISEALKNHIKQTSPQKKLPAFYVLDSVVKNVGTPYTLFFGRQLYSTFMEAYALVSHDVRRKMDEMLKTWKEPVPGSIDTRPVFPPEVTRPIENALIKARTSALQQEQLRSQQQLMNRGRSAVGQAPYRNTPTPPNQSRQPLYPPPGHSGYPQQYPPPANGQQYNNQANGHLQLGLPQRPPPTQYSQQPGSSTSWQQSQPQGYQPPEASVDMLNRDISNLIASSKAEFAQSPYDSSIQTRLKALLDLQTILQTQRLPPDQIAMIKEQASTCSYANTPTTAAANLELFARPWWAGCSISATICNTTNSHAPSPPAAIAIPSPQPQLAVPPQLPFQPTSSAPVLASVPKPAADPNSLLERLRAAGMLPGIPAVSSTPTQPPSALGGANLPGFPPSLPFISAPPVSRTPLLEIPNDVVLKPASLKMFRPHLISNLYEKLGAPCTQCGRRFQSDTEGRKKKAAHMDWHFRVHQRMAEAEKRGQHRSWYVDELDWIKWREPEDDQVNDASDTTQGAAGSSLAMNAKPKLQYLAVPDDPALAGSVCPICQEKFEMKWLDDAQEFVWMDAKKVGDRIYHASCYAEATKDRGTPEPTVLGKRKAEDQEPHLRTKIKTEP